MDIIKVEAEVSKEAYELGQGLAKFVGAFKQALEDGWQTGQDLPVILSSAMADLVPGFQGADKISLEMKEDVTKFSRGVGLCVIDIVDHFVKKEKAA